MAETYKIKIEFRADRGFTLPEHISVPLDSKVEWQVTDQNVNLSSRRFKQSGLQFQLYFSGQSPFSWDRQATRLKYPNMGSSGDGTQRQLAPMTQHLALGIAQERGEFKYGVRVMNPVNNEILYDEDPYIHVF